MIEDIQLALVERCQTLVGEALALPGRVFNPTPGRSYITVRIATSNSAALCIGPNSPELWTGTLQLLVSQPTADGLPRGLRRAIAARDIFPRGLTLVRGNARVVIEGRNIEPSYDSADWLNIPVTIQWFCEETHP